MIQKLLQISVAHTDCI